MFFTLILSSFLTFVELNCENLFDTKHDSLKNDYEFLPQSSYKWTPYRYWRKLANLSKTIVALGYEDLSLVGTASPDKSFKTLGEVLACSRFCGALRSGER